jgi:hypothetical protein
LHARVSDQVINAHLKKTSHVSDWNRSGISIPLLLETDPILLEYLLAPHFRNGCTQSKRKNTKGLSAAAFSSRCELTCIQTTSFQRRRRGRIPARKEEESQSSFVISAFSLVSLPFLTWISRNSYKFETTRKEEEI